jgi:hypothetical protein
VSLRLSVMRASGARCLFFKLIPFPSTRFRSRVPMILEPMKLVTLRTADRSQGPQRRHAVSRNAGSVVPDRCDNLITAPITCQNRPRDTAAKSVHALHHDHAYGSQSEVFRFDAHFQNRSLYQTFVRCFLNFTPVARSINLILGCWTVPAQSASTSTRPSPPLMAS